MRYLRNILYIRNITIICIYNINKLCLYKKYDFFKKIENAYYEYKKLLLQHIVNIIIQYSNNKLN